MKFGNQLKVGKKLLAFEKDIWRKSVHIAKTMHVTNARGIEIMDGKQTIIEDIHTTTIILLVGPYAKNDIQREMAASGNNEDDRVINKVESLKTSYSHFLIPSYSRHIHEATFFLGVSFLNVTFDRFIAFN